MENIIKLVDNFGFLGKCVLLAIMGAFTVSIVVSLLVVLNVIDISTIENIFNISTDFDLVKAVLNLVSSAIK